MSGGSGFLRLHTARILPPLVVGIWCVSAGAMSQQSAPVFRGNVELFTVRVHVTAGRGQPMPELDPTAFSIRIGSRTPVVLFVEHVAIPTEAERASTGAVRLLQAGAQSALGFIRCGRRGERRLLRQDTQGQSGAKRGEGEGCGVDARAWMHTTGSAHH